MERGDFQGEVPSAAGFLNQHSVMVVPLISGGGMRAKILEGMALGKVVLSTRLGMEGIEAKDGRECLLAETPEEWLETLRWCYAEADKLATIGARARAFCQAKYDNKTLAKQLIERIS
jgi:glycosyltransferase involved in cell wall biosynthesis